MTTRLLLAALLLAAGISTSAEAERLPPTGAEIHASLDQLWLADRFDETDRYHSELLAQWPGYVPVRVAHATYLYHQGAQVEALVEELQRLDAELSPEPALYPPTFREAVRSEVARYTKAVARYAERSETPQDRLERFAPRKRPADWPWRLKQWGFQDLFLFAPEVILSPTAPPVPIQRPRETTSDVPQQDATALAGIVADRNAAIDARVAALERLVQLQPEEAVPAAVTAITTSPDYRLNEAGARALAGLGDAGLSALLEVLDTQDTNSSVLTYAIWGLMLAGSDSPVVLQVLEALPGKAPYGVIVADYAREATAYLKSR